MRNRDAAARGPAQLSSSVLNCSQYKTPSTPAPAGWFDPAVETQCSKIKGHDRSFNPCSLSCYLCCAKKMYLKNSFGAIAQNICFIFDKKCIQSNAI